MALYCWYSAPLSSLAIPLMYHSHVRKHLTHCHDELEQQMYMHTTVKLAS